MTLIVGAIFQGKLDFALELSSLTQQYVADGATCSFEELWEKPIVNCFELLVKRMLDEELSVSAEILKLYENNPEIIIITNEIAYGSITDEKELLWRKKCGQACRTLAQRSENIYHIVCGIPTKISKKEW